jgi:hypothetical protein
VRQATLLAVCALAATALLGCQEEAISHYQVSKPEMVRLRAVILPRDQETWFIKLLGPATRVEEQSKAFVQFLDSVQFTKDPKEPMTWKAPEGWKRRPSKSTTRYATLYAGPSDAEVEVTIVKLGKNFGTLLDNVNRWRAQIGLSAIAKDELPRVTSERKVGGVAATLVDLTGPGVGKGRPGLAGPSGRPAYTVPEEWKKTDPAKLSIATWTVGDGDRKAKVTVTPMAGKAGGLVANVNRWRVEQLGLPPADEKTIEKDVQKFEIPETPAQYIDLIGPEVENKTRQRILVVMVVRGDVTWFFKMLGPADLVDKQKSTFETFARSVRFDGGPGANDE